MAINFPSSGLTVGQIVSLGDRSWEWDGEKWKSTGTTSGTPIGATIVFEGAVENAHQTTLTVAEPTADRTITLQNADGTVAFTSDLSTYAPLASPTLTGVPAAPTAADNTNTTQIATTAFVTAMELGLVGVYAPVASPTLTGTPAAPTAAADTNTTQIATTAYVQTELAAMYGPDDENTIIAGQVF